MARKAKQYVVKEKHGYLQDWIDIPVLGKNPQLNDDINKAKRFKSMTLAHQHGDALGGKFEVIPV